MLHACCLDIEKEKERRRTRKMADEAWKAVEDP
jgi:hypothetical protein